VPGLLHGLDERPQKVAVLRPGRIGDFVAATPALRALRRALCDSDITFIGLPLVAALAERCPSIDRFAPFPGFPGVAEQLFDPARALAFLARMQAERFDLAVQLYGSGVYSNPVALLLGARQTAGFVRPGDPAGRLDADLPLPDDGHEIDRALALTTYLGAPPAGRDPELSPLASDDATADRLLGAGTRRPLIGLHAGARDNDRRWPAASLAAAAHRLVADAGGTAVLLGDESAVTTAGLAGAPVDLVGKTSLAELVAVIGRLDVLLTSDSGPAHLAYALGVPTVTAFFTGEPGRTGPPGGNRHRVVWPARSSAAEVMAQARSALGRGLVSHAGARP
jgi:ADP-heptose:LPS heptosyltransferase